MFLFIFPAILIVDANELQPFLEATDTIVYFIKKTHATNIVIRTDRTK